MAVLKAAEERAHSRWPVLMAAVVIKGAYKLDASVRDLSLVGCCIEGDASLPTTGYVLLRFKGLSPLDGRIVWSSGNVAGVVFQPPLHPAVLDHLVRLNPPPEEELQKLK